MPERLVSTTCLGNLNDPSYELLLRRELGGIFEVDELLLDWDQADVCAFAGVTELGRTVDVRLDTADGGMRRYWRSDRAEDRVILSAFKKRTGSIQSSFLRHFLIAIRILLSKYHVSYQNVTTSWAGFSQGPMDMTCITGPLPL